MDLHQVGGWAVAGELHRADALGDRECAGLLPLRAVPVPGADGQPLPDVGVAVHVGRGVVGLLSAGRPHPPAVDPDLQRPEEPCFHHLSGAHFPVLTGG